MQRTFNDPKDKEYEGGPFTVHIGNISHIVQKLKFNLTKGQAREAIVRENPKPIRALPPAEYAKQPTKVNPDMAKRDGCGPEYEMKKCYTEGRIIN